jgi:hypothetical protein
MAWTTDAGITSLNGLTAKTQTFATGTSGSDFSINSATSTHTFNIPDAGASARGAVTTGTQTFAGAKTFSGVVDNSNSTQVSTSAVPSTAAGALNTQGDLVLYNGTKNTIFLRGAGLAAPTTTTRSAGSKIVLFPNITSPGEAEFAVGIEATALWFTIPLASASQYFKFYGNTTEALRVSGTGTVQPTAGVVYTGVSFTTASNTTYTAAQLLSGMLRRQPNGANRTDTMPTASSIVSAIPNAAVGSSFNFSIVNTETGTVRTITLSTNTNVTFASTPPAFGNGAFVNVWCVVTATGTPAVTMYFNSQGFNGPKDFMNANKQATQSSVNAGTDITWTQTSTSGLSLSSATFTLNPNKFYRLYFNMFLSATTLYADFAWYNSSSVILLTNNRAVPQATDRAVNESSQCCAELIYSTFSGADLNVKVRCVGAGGNATVSTSSHVVISEL